MELERLDIIRREDGSLACNGFAEIKTELERLAQNYSAIVFTADEVKAAKDYRAQLNGFKTRAKAELTQRRKEELAKLDDFDRQIKELCAIIDKPIAAIDEQIKAFEEEEKKAKKEKCLKVFESTDDKPDWLTFEQIENPKWTNASFKISDVNKEIIEKITRINNDLMILKEIEFSFEATEFYKRTLDAAAAIAEGKRHAEIQRKKEEAERLAAEEIKLKEVPQETTETVIVATNEPEPINAPSETETANMAETKEERSWMTLQFKINTDDFNAFEKWALDRNIEWRMA